MMLTLLEAVPVSALPRALETPWPTLLLAWNWQEIPKLVLGSNSSHDFDSKDVFLGLVMIA